MTQSGFLGVLPKSEHIEYIYTLLYIHYIHIYTFKMLCFKSKLKKLILVSVLKKMPEKSDWVFADPPGGGGVTG